MWSAFLIGRIITGSEANQYLHETENFSIPMIEANLNLRERQPNNKVKKRYQIKQRDISQCEKE